MDAKHIQLNRDFGGFCFAGGIVYLLQLFEGLGHQLFTFVGALVDGVSVGEVVLVSW
jgi:hypothetical protein